MSGDAVGETKVKILKALADPTRLQILEHLKDGERCVCELIPAVGKAQSTTSKHLDILYDAGIVDRRVEGRRTLYRVKNPKVFEVLKLIESIALEELMRVARALEEMKKLTEQATTS
ncbi:MAG: ArsR family transcriptional regulator [Thermoprotei archaeon]|nr:MAG: ArsR family transcriptional regulator [Thermoprotei archaeon]RLF21487.1 MAG: ArsR family transcriptional regulator [Thermoprotei archaeon]